MDYIDAILTNSRCMTMSMTDNMHLYISNNTSMSVMYRQMTN